MNSNDTNITGDDEIIITKAIRSVSGECVKLGRDSKPFLGSETKFHPLSVL